MDHQETEWTEAPEGWGDEDDVKDETSGNNLDLFGSDPRERFVYKIKVGNNTKSMVLHGFKLDSNETDRSTGVTMWQAAPRLSDYLQEHSDLLLQKRVLEVGAGLGLCGITSLWLGAEEVTMTDGDNHVLKQMRENVSSNCKSTRDDGDDDTDRSNNITCRQLLWGTTHAQKFLESNGQQHYDVILGADVIYTESSIEPLFDTVACLLQKPDGIFVLSRHNKWFSIENEMIIELAKKRHLNCTVDAESEGILTFHWDDV